MHRPPQPQLFQTEIQPRLQTETVGHGPSALHSERRSELESPQLKMNRPSPAGPKKDSGTLAPDTGAQLDARIESGLKSDWVTALNTSVLTTRAQLIKGDAEDLAKLMKTPEFGALIFAAQHLAQEVGCTKEEATERLVSAFRKLERGWEQVLIHRGLNALTATSSK